MICKGCQQEKADVEFPVRSDRSGRLRPYCRACARDIGKARYSYHRRTAPFKLRCSRAKSRAQHLKVPFDLTPDYLETLWTGKCAATGVDIKWDTDKDDEFAAELDRMVPAKGYTQGNVAFLSRRANRLKNNTTVDELEQICSWMKSWK